MSRFGGWPWPARQTLAYLRVPFSRRPNERGGVLFAAARETATTAEKAQGVELLMLLMSRFVCVSQVHWRLSRQERGAVGTMASNRVGARPRGTRSSLYPLK